MPGADRTCRVEVVLKSFQFRLDRHVTTGSDIAVDQGFQGRFVNADVERDAERTVAIGSGIGSSQMLSRCKHIHRQCVADIECRIVGKLGGRNDVRVSSVERDVDLLDRGARPDEVLRGLDAHVAIGIGADIQVTRRRDGRAVANVDFGVWFRMSISNGSENSEHSSFRVRVGR